MLNPEQRETILQRQMAGWDRAREEARRGHPLATLCLHCYGRHRPPNDEICPHDPPRSGLAAVGNEK